MSVSFRGVTDWVQLPLLKWNELTRVGDLTHLLTHRGWDVNLICVLSDLPLDLERSHRFSEPAPQRGQAGSDGAYAG